jgi:subtilisin-like proprotein convertase family protein
MFKASFSFPMKTLLVSLSVVLAGGVSATTTVSGTWAPNVIIPDFNDIGFSSVQTFQTTGINEIKSVVVELSFTSGWNGDLYAYLVHNGVMSVLLNRVGRSVSNPDGASSSGMILTLTDLAEFDVHTTLPFNGVPAGTYQPDGRITDPLSVLDTDPRPATLSVFNGMAADGNWTLFVADQSPGNQSILVSWSLTINGVPEPGSALLSALGTLILLRRRRD